MHTAPNKEYYDKGYKYFSRWMNIILNPLLWKPIFHEELITSRNPRNRYEKQVHINECSMDDVNSFFQKAGFKVNSWYNSGFRMIRGRDKLKLMVSQPTFGFLKKWFAYDIWAIATKP